MKSSDVYKLQVKWKLPENPNWQNRQQRKIFNHGDDDNVR
jgi:hypothetical protein